VQLADLFLVETYLILPKKADQVLVFEQDAVPSDIAQYFKPFVRSPRYFDAPLLDDTPHRILVCTDADVRTDKALHRFIQDAKHKLTSEYGTPPKRRDWFIVKQTPAKVLWQRRHAERHLVLLNPHGFYSYDFYRLRERISEAEVDLIAAALLLSTPTWLFKELFGRTNLGQGALKTEGTDIQKIYVLRPELFSDYANEVAQRVVARPALPLEKELQQPDRRALDDVVFDVLGLTQGEREAVYEAVVELVRKRLEKARSV